jgi:hypothetical protein
MYVLYVLVDVWVKLIVIYNFHISVKITDKRLQNYA